MLEGGGGWCEDSCWEMSEGSVSLGGVVKIVKPTRISMRTKTLTCE